MEKGRFFTLLGPLRGYRWLWITAILLVVASWRVWPAFSVYSRINLSGARTDVHPAAEDLPPDGAPVEFLHGIPHQSAEPGRFLMKTIFAPRKVRRGHVFSASPPETDAGAMTRLVSVLRDPSSYLIWQGEKMCGGFHADWYLRWESGGSVREIVICEGCGEALLFRGGGSVRCDLTPEATERIAEVTRTPGTR